MNLNPQQSVVLIDTENAQNLHVFTAAVDDTDTLPQVIEKLMKHTPHLKEAFQSEAQDMGLTLKGYIKCTLAKQPSASLLPMELNMSEDEYGFEYFITPNVHELEFLDLTI